MLICPRCRSYELRVAVCFNGTLDIQAQRDRPDYEVLNREISDYIIAGEDWVTCRAPRCGWEGTVARATEAWQQRHPPRPDDLPITLPLTVQAPDGTTLIVEDAHPEEDRHA